MAQVMETALNKRKRRDSSPEVDIFQPVAAVDALPLMMQTVATTSNKRKQEDAAHPVMYEVVSQELEDSAVRALHIEEILEKVMVYLPVSDLKSARLVCQMWNDLGAEALEARATLQLPNREGELPSRLFTSVTIKGLHYSFGQELLTTLCNLFKKEGKNVKNLSIDNNQPSESVDIYRGIFDAMTEVETLCVKRFYVTYRSHSPADARTLFENKFPNLKTLQLGNIYPHYAYFDPGHFHDDPAILEIFIEQLFRTNITTLQLEFAYYKILQICDNLLLGDATKRELLPKLECVEVGGTKEALNFVLHLNHPLKKICFEGFHAKHFYDTGSQSHSFLLEQVLKKHSESLEALHIFSLHAKRFTRGKPVFQWPFFPKLEHLNVGAMQYGNYAIVSMISFDPFHIKDLFKNSAELKVKMPSLAQLTLNFQYHVGKLETFYEHLFHFPWGSEDKKFPQIQKLQVYHNLRSTMDKEWPEFQTGWSKIFPNAEITLLPSSTSKSEEGM